MCMYMTPANSIVFNSFLSPCAEVHVSALYTKHERTCAAKHIHIHKYIIIYLRGKRLQLLCKTPYNIYMYGLAKFERHTQNFAAGLFTESSPCRSVVAMRLIRRFRFRLAIYLSIPIYCRREELTKERIQYIYRCVCVCECECVYIYS